MQSEQVRQRKRERKRIQRDENRRSRKRVLPLEIDVAVERRREPEEEARMCARDELDLLVPRRVATLLAAAMRAVRKEAGKPLSPGECLVRISQHYIDKWEPILASRATRD